MNQTRMQDTTDGMFEILYGYYVREIGFLLEKVTDRENPDYGWFVQPLDLTIMGKHYSFIGFSFQPRPTKPKAIFILKSRHIKFKRRRHALHCELVDKLSLDTLKEMRRHLLLDKNLTDDPLFAKRYQP